MVQAPINYENTVRAKVAAGSPVYEWTDGVDSWGIYPYNGSPESNVTANRGSLCVDYANGRLYRKTTASGNTGWQLTSIDLLDSVANLGALDTNNPDGHHANVATNLLRYLIEGGTYSVEDHFIRVPTEAAFGAITEPAENMQVHVDDINARYKYSAANGWYQISPALPTTGESPTRPYVVATAVTGLPAAPALVEAQRASSQGFATVADDGANEWIYRANGRAANSIVAKVASHPGWYRLGSQPDDYFEATNKTVADALQWGCIANDAGSATANTAIIQKMADAAQHCVFPAIGDTDTQYHINGPITMRAGTTFTGSTKLWSRIRASSDLGVGVAAVTMEDDCTIRDLNFNGTATGANTGDAIAIPAGIKARWLIDNCNVFLFNNGLVINEGIVGRVVNSDFGDHTDAGIRLLGPTPCNDITLQNVRVATCSVGLHLATAVTNLRIHGGSYEINTYGIHSTVNTFLFGMDLTGVYFEANATKHIESTVAPVAASITGASKADPVVITAVAHGFSTNDWIIVSGIVSDEPGPTPPAGFHSLNGHSAKIVKLTDDTFEMTGIDGIAFETYQSGGTAAKGSGLWAGGQVMGCTFAGVTSSTEIDILRADGMQFGGNYSAQPTKFLHLGSSTKNCTVLPSSAAAQVEGTLAAVDDDGTGNKVFGQNEVPSYALLVTGRCANKGRAEMLGYTTPGDGGARPWVYFKTGAAANSITNDGFHKLGTDGDDYFQATKLNVANVMEFGAIPNDITKAAANVTAIQLAADAASEVYFPSTGDADTAYHIDAQLAMNAGSRWYGSTKRLTRIRASANLGAGVAAVLMTTDCTLQDLSIQGLVGASNNDGDAISNAASGQSNMCVVRCNILQFENGIAIREANTFTISECDIQSLDASGVQILGTAACSSVTIKDSSITTCVIGVEINETVNSLRIIGGRIASNSQSGVESTANVAHNSVDIDGVFFSSNGVNHIKSPAAGAPGGLWVGGKIAACQFAGTVTGESIDIVRADGLLIEGNYFAEYTTAVTLGANAVNCVVDIGSAAQQVAGTVASITDNGVNNHLRGILLRGKERSADPANPPEGEFVIWQSDGVGTGDDGDILIKITAGAVTKTATLADHSAL